MLATDNGFVLKNSENKYFIGMNQADPQLRKAKIYHSIRHATAERDDINNNPHRVRGAAHDFDLVPVEIREVESTS